MVKEAPSLGRLLAMVVFTLSCFGLLLFLWLAFGGPIPFQPKGYRFHTSFQEAGQLALQADVRISGVPVGKVVAIEPDKRTGRSNVTIQLDSRYAPLPSDARAILRQKTLLGETYVALTPGHAWAKPIPEGGTLAAAQVSDTVELDEILRAFDPATREAFRVWMQQQALAIGGHGRALNNALGNLGPFADDAARVVTILNRQQGAVTRLVANTGVVFAALSERDGQLRSLIRNANRVFTVTAARNRQLQQSFVALPTFEDESRKTLIRLTAFAANTNPLVTQLRPAARQLSPTLRDLEAISPDLRALLNQLGPLITASKTGFPAAAKVLDELEPLLKQAYPVSQQLTPLLQFLALNQRELTSFFANTSAATQAKDPQSGLHYLRTQNPLNPENLAVYPRRLPSNRPNAYRLPGGFDELARGLAAYETRQCGRRFALTVTNQPVPGLSLPLTAAQMQALIPDQLLANVRRFALGGVTNAGDVTAVPCRQQDKFHFGGVVTQYPQVRVR